MLVHKSQNIPLSRRGNIQAGQAVPNFKIEIFFVIHSVVDDSGRLFYDRRDLLLLQAGSSPDDARIKSRFTSCSSQRRPPLSPR